MAAPAAILPTPLSKWEIVNSMVLRTPHTTANTHDLCGEAINYVNIPCQTNFATISPLERLVLTFAESPTTFLNSASRVFITKARPCTTQRAVLLAVLSLRAFHHSFDDVFSRLHGQHLIVKDEQQPFVTMLEVKGINFHKKWKRWLKHL